MTMTGMSDVERLVLEKHQLLAQLAQRDAIILTLIEHDGIVKLAVADIVRNMGSPPVYEQTTKMLKISQPAVAE